MPPTIDCGKYGPVVAEPQGDADKWYLRFASDWDTIGYVEAQSVGVPRFTGHSEITQRSVSGVSLDDIAYQIAREAWCD